MKTLTTNPLNRSRIARISLWLLIAGATIVASGCGSDSQHSGTAINDGWLNSPPGMQERSVGQWYSLWHSNHTGGVVVQHDGNKVASWTNDGGYKPETKSKGEEAHTES